MIEHGAMDELVGDTLKCIPREAGSGRIVLSSPHSVVSRSSTSAWSCQLTFVIWVWYQKNYKVLVSIFHL